MKAVLTRSIDNVSGLQIFQMLRFGTLILISILFAKSSLSQEEIGVYETLLLLSGSLSFFWVSGLLNGLLPIYKTSSINEQKTLIYKAFISALLINLVVFILLVLGSGVVKTLLTDSGELPYYLLFCFFILINNPSYLTEYIYLLIDKPKSVVRYGLIVFTVQLLLVAGPVLLGYGLGHAIIGLIIFAAIKLMWTIGLLSKHAHIKTDWTLWKKYAFIALPLMGSLFLGGASQYIDGFIISNYFDRSSFALFQYRAREFPLTLILANAFSTAMVPVVAGNLNDSLNRIRRRSTKLIHLLFPISFLLLISSEWLYPIVFNTQFSESYVIFNIYILLICSRLLFPQTILIGLKKTHIILFASTAEIIVNVSLSLLFLQWYGMIGVAYATVIAFLVDKLILLIYNQFVMKIRIREYLNLPLYLIYSIILAACF